MKEQGEDDREEPAMAHRDEEASHGRSALTKDMQRCKQVKENEAAIGLVEQWIEEDREAGEGQWEELRQELEW